MFKNASIYKDIFNQRADSYHDAMMGWPNARTAEFEALLAGLAIRPGTRMIDIPAGGGYLSRYLPQGTDLTHLETSELFLELGHSGSQYPLKLCELDELPIADGSIDIAVSLAGLHHTEDKTPLFEEIYRGLVRDGIFVIADAGAGSATANFLDGWIGIHNSMGHRGWYLDQETDATMRDIGFLDVSHETRHYHWVFANPKEAAKYCKLMFGIDQASVEEIETALEQYLGFEQLDGEKTGLCWQLDFITARKP